MTKREIEQMKSSVCIKEVVEGYVSLERKGSNYMGLCPFHEDHHPSLIVNPEKQTFHCFACGEHGDAIAFVQKMEHCSFMEAVGKLKMENGKLKINKKKAESVPVNTNEKKFSIEKNCKFFSSLLPYACGNSELTPAYLDFEVGQSPVNVPKEWYAMRNRVIFPIRDEAGQLIAFAARRLADGNPDEPKYINTSTAGGYKKSDHLYALNRAKEAIVREGFVFVVEGYKDAIAMHAAGLTNTVALCGTALTGGQGELLKRYTGHLCLLLDGDKPGRDAARKIALSQEAVFPEIQVLYLPEGEDPDSLFRRHGREVFVALIDRCRTRPHYSEELLLSACLLYADTYYFFKGEFCLFTEVIHTILRSDNLLFEHGDYRTILSHLAEGYPEADLEMVLRGVADGLHAEYDGMVRQGVEAFRLLYPEASNYREMYLVRLLFFYTENRILKDIRKTVRALLQSSPDETGQRLEMLVHIAERRELLRHVAENLDRPGTVWG